MLLYLSTIDILVIVIPFENPRHCPGNLIKSKNQENVW